MQSTYGRSIGALTTVLLITGSAQLIAQAQQMAPRTLTLTTASEEARNSFYEAATNLFNVHPTLAASLAKKAMAADPNFGMARAMYAWANPPELTAEQREQELNRAVADAARASTGELLAATTIRALALNRAAEANVLLDAMIALLPDDPVPPYLRATRSADQAKVVADLEAVTRKFPDFAPAFNILAYQRWAAGDREGAMKAVQEYVRLAPNHPNPHDSYAEILQFAGRYPEALQHYQRSAEIDPSFGGGSLGIAEVHLLMGHPAVARGAYAKAADVATTPAGKLGARAAGTLTYLLEGKTKNALRELMSVAAAAEQQNLKPQAASFHRMGALIEAMFGDRNAVAGHLAGAASLGGADVPAQHRFTALAYAAAGRVDLATSAAAKYQEAMANGTPTQQRTVRELNAVVATAERNFARAQSELSQAGAAATLGKAILAHELSRAGRKAEAQALKAEIMGTGTATAFDVLARARVQKI